MYNYMDSNSYWISIIYFCFMVVFGSFFAMQLVLANIMDSFARDQQKQSSALAEEEVHEEKKIEIAGLFLNAAKGKPIDKPSSSNKLMKKDGVLITPEENDNIVMPHREPAIANNAEIAKKLSNVKQEEKAQ